MWSFFCGLGITVGFLLLFFLSGSSNIIYSLYVALDLCAALFVRANPEKWVSYFYTLPLSGQLPRNISPNCMPAS